ncbi:MAG: transglycosylase domain-containing protein [Desulfobacteraceae bacterium]|nr:transglycosylase domain-containing protein [Desulfobacteraceae bacterium]
MSKHFIKWIWPFLSLMALSTAMLSILTFACLQPLPDLTSTGPIAKPQLLDRNGRPITITYQNQWNLHDQVPLREVPALLQTAFILSEDQRFYSHHGVDWLARLNAVRQNLLALRPTRGASTISEQVVRLLHPRPRTIWSRWLEGFEARRLEKVHSKADILEWYLNQVPFASQRRGVKQAARFYFERDLDTLSIQETLALAVMVRAPAYFNPYKNAAAVERQVARLAQRMRSKKALSEAQWLAVSQDHLKPVPAAPPVDVRHFARYVAEHSDNSAAFIRTTLDIEVQRFAQQILDQRLQQLQARRVSQGAVLVADLQTNEVRAWAVGNNRPEDKEAGTGFDVVRTPRQPGSALKPFVYALALSRDWTPATFIDDSPLNESVGLGLHTYHNYSHTHYGPVSLRQALASSLNVPAVKAAQYVGPEAFLTLLRDLGIHSLTQHPDFYGDGLALGNGEVTLLELVQAYTVLARRGRFAPLKVVVNASGPPPERQVLREEVTSLMGDILSDADARRLEFSEASLLNLPVQTAVKTGTSSGYRDAWAVGYDYGHAVGVWMGNLDNRPMNEVTGAVGPVLVLRAIFAELNRNRNTAPLYFSRRLEAHKVCIDTGRLADGRCPSRQEWFVPGKLPQANVTQAEPVRIARPFGGLQLAMDPRIPDEAERFEFKLNREQGVTGVDWLLDGQEAGRSKGARYLWPLRRGEHRLQARIHLAGQTAPVLSQMVRFEVK